MRRFIGSSVHRFRTVRALRDLGALCECQSNQTKKKKAKDRLKQGMNPEPVNLSTPLLSLFHVNVFYKTQEIPRISFTSPKEATLVPIKIDTDHGRGVWGHEVSPLQCLNHSSNAPWKTIKSARHPIEAPMSSPFSFSKN